MQLITHSTNLRYLINFTGSSGFLLLGLKKNYFFTDFRYREIAEKLVKEKTRIPFEFVEMDADFQKKLQKIAAKKVEFEEDHMTISGLKRWKKLIPKAKFIASKKTTEQKRLFKDSQEIKLLKKSQEINEKVLLRVKKLFKEGVTELELAWKIKAIGHELGAEDISFEPIVAFGAHSAIPHHKNSYTKMKKNDIVLIDMGMKFQGYCSDMTRTFFHGKAKAEWRNIYNKVLDSQMAGIHAVKAGVRAAKVDKIARESMGEDAKHFGHSLGHGIGLDVHENPNLSSKSKDVLKENMVVTVEPGIYLPGKFGVRIEDMGRVTKKGYENFTCVEK